MIRSLTELRAVMLMLQRCRRRVEQRRKSLQQAGIKAREAETALEPLKAECVKLEEEIAKFKKLGISARKRKGVTNG